MKTEVTKKGRCVYGTMENSKGICKREHKGGAPLVQEKLLFSKYRCMFLLQTREIYLVPHQLNNKK